MTTKPADDSAKKREQQAERDRRATAPDVAPIEIDVHEESAPLRERDHARRQDSPATDARSG